MRDEGDIADDPEISGSPPASPSAPQADALLRRAIDLIDSARPMPLSTSSIINKEEVLELLTEAVDRLPDELRAARWLLKERDEYLAKIQREGEEMLDVARARAQRMVERTEVNKAAEQRARRIIEHAKAESRKMRHEVEDFCDQKLAGFEAVLERTSRVVANGRLKLQGPATAPSGDEPPEVDSRADDAAAAFFDQDQ